jgi:hypothetical protein
MSVNVASDMTKAQGLSKTAPYEAIVVANDDTKHEDKRMLGRVQFRIPKIYDSIEDKLLPWAIPQYGSHPDGASSESGYFAVPKVGSKVLVYFQDGSPLHPKYAPYTVDASTALKEREHNYPNRVVHLFKNTALLMVDTQSNEMFIRNPGNLNIFIQGNVNMRVDGNVLEKIQGNRITHVKGNVTEVVDGNKTLYLQGDYSETIKGKHDQFVDGTFLEKIGSSRQLFVGSSSSEKVGSSRGVYVGGDDTHNVSGHIIRIGARIDDNPGGGGGSGGNAPDAPSKPQLPNIPYWPVVRGKKPDTTDEKPNKEEPHTN